MKKNGRHAGSIVVMALVCFIFIFGFSALAFSADCQQKRKTPKAPDSIYNKKNPLESSPENISAGKKMYQKGAKPLACIKCHGEKGDGLGKIAKGMTPKPKDFTCRAMMGKIPDGQLFWIIQNGSKGTGMMGFKKLKDEQVWQLILYLRQFAG